MNIAFLSLSNDGGDMRSGPLLLLLICLPVLASAQKAPDVAKYPIAGLAPSERPAGAPVIKEIQRSKDWESRFFQGISKPYPPNLGELANWGAWYVPFDHPGMVDRYDIRDWHQDKKPKARGGRKS